jgi:hypothetical protein
MALGCEIGNTLAAMSRESKRRQGATVKLHAIDLEDLQYLRESFAVIFRACGLRGRDLDVAIADCTTAACSVIEKNGAAGSTRDAQIRVVGGGIAD